MCFFFFNDTATTEIYTLSLHDALPICEATTRPRPRCSATQPICSRRDTPTGHACCTRSRERTDSRSEEHTSELQSQSNLVCRLLLEKKKKSIYLLSVTTPPTHATATSH